MFEVSQSSCSCCYDGDMQFPTFAECWQKNPSAHMFPDKSKMKRGCFKTCFIGMLGVPADDLPQLAKDIYKYNPKLGTQDIVTCIELGGDHYGSIFKFYSRDRVIVVKDVLRPALVNRQGVLQVCRNNFATIQMIDVLEKDIRKVTKGSSVRVTLDTSPLYGYEGIVQQDGSLDGWCCVEIDAKLFTIPTIWTTTVFAKEPLDCNWESAARVNIQCEQIVPTHDPNTNIVFHGDGEIDLCKIINHFDPDGTVTPRTFKAFDCNMRDWSDQAQKDAVVESICEKSFQKCNHSVYFDEEFISGGMDVFFNWERCYGTQSIFESKKERWLYIDDTSPDVRAQAFIGWSSSAHGIIQWEIPHNRQVGRVERILQRDEGLMVPNSRVTRRFDYTSTGTILYRMGSASMYMVEWNGMVDGLGVPLQKLEKLADLERSVFIQKVVIPPGLLRGTVQDFDELSPPTHVHVAFKDGNTIADEIGGAWFNLEQLADSRFRYRLGVFLSYPWRVVRFSVQERVGMSIACMNRDKRKLIISTSSAMYNFRQAMGLFCNGVSKMHYEHITHNDMHDGNVTIAQTEDGEFFSVKMIDFDRMQRQPANGPMHSFLDDLKNTLKGLHFLVKNTRCGSTCPSVQRNNAMELQALSKIMYKLKRDIRDMQQVHTSNNNQTAKFLVMMATHVVHAKNV